jgi:hypothetical protein
VLRVAVALFLAVVSALPVWAQSRTSWQAQVIGTTATVPFVGAGLGAGIEWVGRVGLAANASIGVAGAGDDVAGRFEGMATFHLNPGRQRGVAPYAAGGIAVIATRASAGYLLLLLGIESSPRASRGWFVELGLGGGFRMAAGLRWRPTPVRRR